MPNETGYEAGYMIKELAYNAQRKANHNVEEWLNEGIAAAAADRMQVDADANQEAAHTVPTAEGNQQSVAPDRRADCTPNVATHAHVVVANPDVALTSVALAQAEVAGTVGVGTGDRAVSSEEAVEWFWDLLAQCGYERW